MCADLRIVVNMRLMVRVVLTTGTTNPRSRRRRLRLGRPRRLHVWFGFCLLSFLAIFHRARGKIGHWKTLNIPWSLRPLLCHISSKTMLLFGLASISQVGFPPTAHAGIWMSFDVGSGKNTRQLLSRITSFFVEAPRCWDLKQKNWISWMSGRERWLFAKIQKFIFPEFYWVLIFWRREMAASFRQTALSAMTGDGWMLIWIILKVESDTFWLLWFSKILTEYQQTKKGVTFSFTFKLCHGGHQRLDYL